MLTTAEANDRWISPDTAGRAGHLRRFWSVFSFLIVYRPDTQPVEIVHIIHGARNLEALFDPDRKSENES